MAVVVGRKVRAAPDTTVVFEVTGPVGRALAISMEGERSEGGSAPETSPPSHKELTL